MEIYISSHGSSIYTLMGYMNKHSIDCKKFQNWYCFGSAVLIPFLKFMGKTYYEIFSILSHENFDFLQLLAPGRILANKPQDKIKNNIKELLLEIMAQHVSQSQFENLERFYEMTGCDLNISTWDEKNNRHVFINRNNFKGKVIEVIMIALCCSTYYPIYEVGDHVFSDSSWVVHPMKFFLESTRPSFAILPYYNLVEDDIINAFTFLEKSFMKQFINYNNYHLSLIIDDKDKKLMKLDTPLNHNTLRASAKKNLHDMYS